MKTRSKTLRQLLLLLLGAAFFTVFIFWLLANNAQHTFEMTREELRREGFKTDLFEFDFSAGLEGKSWGSLLQKAMSGAIANGQPAEHPDLLPAAGSNVAIVVWKHEWLEDVSDEIDWQVFNALARGNQSDVDAAAQVLISGAPKIGLDASKGMAMLLPHLPMIKGLAQTFGSRTMVEMHDGDTAAAWTNLLALTRMVTAIKPTPINVEHLVRFACLNIAFNSIWQALQTNTWSDAQLAQLQEEWEHLNLFEDLPETAAFRRAGAVAMCRSLLKEPFEFQLVDTFKEFTRSPRSGWTMLKFKWQECQYRIRGCWLDQSALLIHFRDREIEIRNAIRASTWRQMQVMPGVTNFVFFESKFRGARIQTMLNLQELNMAFFRGGSSFLGRAAEAEARRRILITALALERYRVKHGTYPASLQALTPDYLSVLLPDFINGEPLQYNRGSDDRFVLYSPGIDDVDNGGQMRQLTRHERLPTGGINFIPIQSVDLVWPRAATTDELTAYQASLIAEATERFIEDSRRTSQYFWSAQIARQAKAAYLHAGHEGLRSVETFKIAGEPIEKYLQPGSTNSLHELLTLQPVRTGREPEIMTFELPFDYSALTKIGTIRLAVDAESTVDELETEPFTQAVCEPGTNGRVRLTWNTIFETPGTHVVQALLIINPTAPDFELRNAAGPARTTICDHLCQFGMASTGFDTNYGAPLHMRFPEPVATYALQLLSTNGQLLRTFSGTTSNGTALLHWDLSDDDGRRWNGNFFESRLEVTLPASGRSNQMKGP